MKCDVLETCPVKNQTVLAECRSIMSVKYDHRNSQTIGNEEIPDSPEPDVGLPPAIGQNPELTPPTEEVTQPAGFKQQEEATSSNSFNKVCSLSLTDSIF